MIDDIVLVVDKEWRSFRASDRSLFLVYAVMALFYGCVFVFTDQTQTSQVSSVLWWVFFSVVGGSTFMNPVFTAMRLKIS